MIKEMTFVKSKNNHAYSYVVELESIQSIGGKIEFTDGLNIIVGFNRNFEI